MGDDEPDHQKLIDDFLAYADDVRHPSLRLDCFLDAMPEYDLSDDALGSVTESDDYRTARARRGALLHAANLALDEVLEDLINFDDEDDGQFRFINEHFPPRYAHHYDAGFTRSIVATVAKVAVDLCNPESTYPSCTAEELVLYAILHEWTGLLDMTELGQPWTDLTDQLFEDLDFENLYDPETDGLEDDPLTIRTTGLLLVPFNRWFVPFNRDRIVHPFAVDHAQNANVLFDLAQTPPSTDTGLLAPDSGHGFAPVSELVAEARVDERSSSASNVWVPDEHDPQQSLASFPDGDTLSGYLMQQAGPQSGVSRVPVLSFAPHLQHSVHGVAWADVVYFSGRSEVPLSAVVSFEPDPDVRTNWEMRFAELLDHDD